MPAHRSAGAKYGEYLHWPPIPSALAPYSLAPYFMAGLLLQELKIRGVVRRVLIVAPANMTFQWQREMKDYEGCQSFNFQFLISEDQDEN